MRAFWSKSGEIPESSWKAGKYSEGSGYIDRGMGARTVESRTKCDYCGKRLVVQDRQGGNADGNRVVLEVDGSQKRACRSCAERLSMGPSERTPQSAEASEAKGR